MGPDSRRKKRCHHQHDEIADLHRRLWLDDTFGDGIHHIAARENGA